MRFDWDIVRKILLEIEDKISDNCKSFIVDYEEDFKTGYHLKRLVEEGYVTGKEIKTIKWDSVEVKGLTMKGHELLDSLREESTLNKIKDFALKKGIPFTLKTALEVAKAYALSQLSS